VEVVIVDIQVFQDFVDQNVSVRSQFLFAHYESTTSDDLQYALSLIAFTAELILFRRNSFPGPLVISADLVDALTDMRGLHPHVLMRVAVDPATSGRAPREIMQAYYGDHLRRLRLGSLLGRQETSILRRHDLGLESIFSSASPADRGGDGGMASSSLAPGGRAALSRIIGQSAAGTGLPRVSIIGFHKAVLGLGEDARCLFASLCEIGVSPELIDVSPGGLEPHEDIDGFDCFEAVKPTGEILIFCLPAIEMMRVLVTLKPSIDRLRQYIVGYWPWETTRLPDQWTPAYDEVDEIWASTSFLERVYRSATSKPVRLMPLYVHVTEPPAPIPSRSQDGIFRFVTVFDLNSRVARKNPEGAIEAFRRAFDRQDQRVELLVKTIHAEHHSSDFRKLQESVADDGRITIFNRAMAKQEVDALIASSDAYVSLHRAEGFGRPLVEAMMLRTAVIATQWSGSADYLTSQTGYPVRSTLRAVEAHEYPFAAGEWAEPDLDHAAGAMRAAFTDRMERERRVEAAYQSANRRYQRPAVSAALRLRLLEIGRSELLDEP
jgi:glycosyltransferase involved in cell wall biosynthesis